MSNINPAETVYVETKEDSYGIFCFNDHGDLFLNSDWGMFGYAWRHYNGTFKDFLKQCNAPYIASKFAINWNQCVSKAEMFKGTREQHVTNLIKVFIEELNKTTINEQ